jgi:hypothetical protein
MSTTIPARLRSVALSALAAGALAGCIDFSGPRLDRDPVNPSASSFREAFLGMQGYQFANLNGDFTRLAAVYVQHMSGTGRQWLTLDAPYINDEGQFGSWSSFYSNGGLIDIRKAQRLAREAGDQRFLGMTQVWEALSMSYVADFWGNAVYREALRPGEPGALDPQRQIYADLQRLLDSAITNLGGPAVAQGSWDLVYGGSAAQWRRAARSLKARLLLRTANVDNTAYAAALAQAQQGILDPADDFRTYQSSTAGEENIWFQFRRGRGTDISAGGFLVNLMRTRGDPRLTQYFAQRSGQVVGAAPGEETSNASWLSTARGDPGFRQPIITADETQLIIAEAQARAGSAGPALATLNEVRARAGLPALAGLTGTPLLVAILEEKYVSLFQSPEVWADWKRTCYPNFALANGATSIPMRFIYGADERSTNPNIPQPNAAPRRNEVNPRVVTAADGTPCRGQPN